MASSGVEVCSKALALIGIPAIASFDEGTDAAAACELVYESVVERLLGDNDWRFAMTKVRLSRLNETPVNEWKHAYQLPSNRDGNLFAAFDTDAVGVVPFKDYEIFGETLLTNADDVYIDYKIRAAEEDWPPYFTSLVIYALAAHLAPSLKDSTSEADMWMRVAFGGPEDSGKGGYFRTAANVDAKASPSQRIEDFSLINARWGG